MAFMKPVAEHFAAYLVETDCGTEVVPEDVCGKLDPGNGTREPSDPASFTPYESATNLAKLEPFIQGSKIHDVCRKEGWWSRLSANGYLDCTEWLGPFEDAETALAEVCEMHDVDDNGDDASEAGGEP